MNSEDNGGGGNGGEENVGYWEMVHMMMFINECRTKVAPQE